MPNTKPASQSGPPSVEPNAYTRTLCKIHLDMHCPEWDGAILSRFDASAIVRTVRESGCRAMVVFAKDAYGNAYYPTRVGHRHACMGERDLLGEFLEAGQRLGVRMAAYYCAILDNHAAAAHPEWALRGPDGEVMADTVTNDGAARWHSVCPNSGFAELAEVMVEEIASGYAVEGFHLDMFNLDFGGVSCYCDTCRRLFREQTGFDIPGRPIWDAAWRAFLDFRYWSVERYMRRLRAVAHRYRPEVPVLMNFHAGPGFDWRPGQRPVQHSLPSDTGTIETYTPMLGTLYPGLGTRFVRSLNPGRPLEVVSWRMNRITDFTTKPANQLRWELFSSMCYGASSMLIDQVWHDGTVDPYPYRRLGPVFEEARRKQPFLGGEPVKHVAIYYSVKTRDLYGRSHHERFMQPVVGAYKACVESHFETAFVFDETVDAEELAQYPVLVLPNVAVLSERECARIAEYVTEGGSLVATLDTSRFDEAGAALPNFGLAEVFGVDYVDTHDCDAAWLRGLGEVLGAGIDPACYILTEGPTHRVLTAGAEGMGDLHDSFHKCRVPEQFYSHSLHPPHVRLGDAAFVHAYGRGRAVYFPSGVDRAYAGLHELPEHRALMANAVRSAGHRPDIEVQAPLNVESAVLRKGRDYIIHLLGFNPNHQATTLPDLNRPIRPSLRMETPPMYRASLRLNIPVASVHAFNETTAVHRDGDTVDLVCEDVHEIIVITPS